jgi:hypothetical protein
VIVQRARGIVEVVLSVALVAVCVPATSAWASSSVSTLSGFGFKSFEASFTTPSGAPDTQAGSHPHELNLTFEFYTGTIEKELGPLGGEPRSIVVNLPPGVIGYPSAVTRCTRAQIDVEACPRSSQVGEAEAKVHELLLRGLGVYNMVPPPGVPAQLAFTLEGITTFSNTGVRTGGPTAEASDYGITTRTNNIPQLGVNFTHVVIWGVPSEFGVPGEKPFLTLPTSCEGPLTFSLEATSWAEPHETARIPFESPPITGCERLNFKPSISAAPDTAFADTPAGLNVEVQMPLTGLTEAGHFAPSDIKDTTVELPAGVAINPGQAAGLVACQETEASLRASASPASCPSASKVGTVKIKTPLLEGEPESELEGNVYILQSNPPNLELLIAASADGVNLKLVGKVTACEAVGEMIDGKSCKAAGQLISKFEDTPELPFSAFQLSFSGGAQAALGTPTACGVYETTSDFTPWASPYVADASPTSAFAITGGPDGGPCPSSPLPFAPSLIAGSTTDQAGGYTDFSLLLQNGDDQQRISSLQFKAPPGLAGMISQVPLCPESQAEVGTCPAASQIGHAVVASGPGPYPLVIPEPGEPPARVYLTGPYEGAPFGLSIVTPVIAGPFNLGTNVVRAKIEVDPRTAQITVTTDASGPHAIPPILDGIPTDLRTIDTVVDRPGFMFNPTNCNPTAFTGTAAGSEGASVPLESRFQVGSCQALKFAPNFKVATSAKTSRKEGASLNAQVLYPNTPPGDNQASSQANIHSVKVELPKQLPSRLSTLQKACLASIFEANPASCPAASVVGHATAISPVLPVALTGPAYFVSHGGEAFPSLIVVLQGDNVTVDLEGTTFISKKGITSSTFKNVPDVPIDSFELTLSQGPYSALAANGNLCNETLAMPTEFVGQNGAEIHQSTPITVTGCPKKHHPKRHSRVGRKHTG